jgi:hypothetical protein
MCAINGIFAYASSAVGFDRAPGDIARLLAGKRPTVGQEVVLWPHQANWVFLVLLKIIYKK